MQFDELPLAENSVNVFRERERESVEITVL